MDSAGPAADRVGLQRGGRPRTLRSIERTLLPHRTHVEQVLHPAGGLDPLHADRSGSRDRARCSVRRDDGERCRRRTIETLMPAGSSARPTEGGEGARRRRRQGPSIARAHVLLELLRLRESIGEGPGLEGRSWSKLVERGRRTSRTRHQRARVLARLPRDHEFLHARSGYVQWLRRNRPGLPDRARVKIAEDHHVDGEQRLHCAGFKASTSSGTTSASSTPGPGPARRRNQPPTATTRQELFS